MIDLIFRLAVRRRYMSYVLYSLSMWIRFSRVSRFTYIYLELPHNTMNLIWFASAISKLTLHLPRIGDEIWDYLTEFLIPIALLRIELRDFSRLVKIHTRQDVKRTNCIHSMYQFNQCYRHLRRQNQGISIADIAHNWRDKCSLFKRKMAKDVCDTYK